MDKSEKPPVTTTVTVAGLNAGNPSSLTTTTRAVNSQGIARHITQRVAVRDADLFQRLCAEVSQGDEISVTLVTDWSATDYRMSLVDFAKLTADVSRPMPTRELAAQAA